MLYIATSEKGTLGYAHSILGFAAKQPCVIRCKYAIKSTCLSSKRLLSGLAFYCCPKRTLYASDGLRNLELIATSTSCGFLAGRCCAAAGDYRGLAVTPGWTLTHLGKSCMSKPCRVCPNTYLATAGGDPSLGNPKFSLDLINAPTGSLPNFAVMYIRGAACSPGFPVFCGRFYPLPFHIGPLAAPISGSGCSGFARMPLPIPASANLCGLKLCTQYLILCPRAVGLPGIGLSNALQFQIVGS